jgi:hypothetical protein
MEMKKNCTKKIKYVQFCSVTVRIFKIPFILDPDPNSGSITLHSVVYLSVCFDVKYPDSLPSLTSFINVFSDLLMAQAENAELRNRQPPENVPDASYREDFVDFRRSFKLDEKTTESTLPTEEITDSPIMDRTSESSQEVLLLKQRLQLKEAMLANQASRIQDLDKEIVSLKGLCKEYKAGSLVKEDLTEASRNNYLEREVATLNGLCKEYKEATSINEDILAIQANQIQKLDKEVFTLQDLVGGQREAAEVKDKVLKGQAGQIQDLKDQCEAYKEVIQGLEAQLSEETAAQGLGCSDFDYFVEIN